MTLYLRRTGCYYKTLNLFDLKVEIVATKFVLGRKDSLVIADYKIGVQRVKKWNWASRLLEYKMLTKAR